MKIKNKGRCKECEHFKSRLETQKEDFEETLTKIQGKIIKIVTFLEANCICAMDIDYCSYCVMKKMITGEK